MATKLDFINSRGTIFKKIHKLAEKVANHDTDALTLAAVTVHLQDLEKWGKLADELHEKIMVFCNDDADITTEDDAAIKAGDDMSELRIELYQLQIDLGGMGNGNKTRSSNGTGNLRLPRMDVPTFTGSYVDWIKYKKVFEDLIHFNGGIPNAQKLHYLRTSLQGDAAQFFDSVDNTDVTYDEAWDRVVERYDSKRQIIKKHMEIIFGQDKLKCKSAHDLRRIVETTTRHETALDRLGATTLRDVLVYLIPLLLDADTQEKWNIHTSGSDYPEYDDMLRFLKDRCSSLECFNEDLSVSQPQPAPKKPTGQQQQRRGGKSANLVSTGDKASVRPSGKCHLCQDSHQLYKCPKFNAMDGKGRREAVRISRLCYNCLSSGHGVSQCQSSYTCRQCNSKHHSMLHQDEDKKKDDKTQSNSSAAVHLTSSSYESSIIPTAVVDICDVFGQQQQCRVLLDTGSQISLITESCVQKLGLKRMKASVPIVGITEKGSGITRGMVHAELISRVFSFKIHATLYVMPRLTGDMPSSNILGVDGWPHVNEKELADPTFHVPGRVDIIIGMDLYDNILLHGSGTYKTFHNKPSLRKSHFGWLVRGSARLDGDGGNKLQSSCKVCVMDVQDQLARFWEIEELQSTPIRSPEDIHCDNHFITTHKRQPDGRYVVSLPFKDTSIQLGSSKQQAIRRLLQVERRLSRSPDHRSLYNNFMEQYLALGHMEEVPGNEINKEGMARGGPYYLPHHFVEKKSSTSTKLRVVFDGSAKTSSGASLNDLLMVGPPLQNDIFEVLTRFRQYPIVIIADIEKFFRQVRISEADADYQRIMWRSSTRIPMKEYRLRTVTYGTAPAPFLASRALMQLASDVGEQYPLAKEVINRDIYVDDVMTGGFSLESVLEIKSQLCRALNDGQFPLVKWSSNCPAVLETISPSQRETQLPLPMDKEDSIKALGLFWNPGADKFFFKVNLPPVAAVTKRTMLSDSAKLYDPLGLLAPVTFRAKIMFQELWKLNLGWDDPLPPDVASRWLEYRAALKNLETIEVSRFMDTDAKGQHQLHGFSDASEVGYSAVTYIRSEGTDGQVKVKIIAAKTKVAPVKVISIPKLELCGATLLARLMSRVQRVLTIPISASFAWTDSTDVLAWIAKSPHLWKTFVANRVSEIQTLTGSVEWNHVPGKENPADCASRGISPSELKSHPLWWTGPEWLSRTRDHWPWFNPVDLPTQLLEQRPVQVLVALVDKEPDLVSRYSSLRKLVCVTAFCLRFISRCRGQLAGPSRCLSPSERRHALMYWVKKVQGKEFADVIHRLEGRKDMPPAVASLNLFMDPDGMLRVGGRLAESDLAYDRKHPLLLPQSHRLTELIVDDAHHTTIHGSTQLMMATLRRMFWIPNMRKVIRRCTFKCVRCTRFRGKTMEQQMGNLPPSRVLQGRAFQTTGVDYAGPFTVKSWKGRGAKHYKAYVALFVCFTTKAVHLEVVSDLTTDAFVAALRRFVARRGKPVEIRSDNGTNFVGANRELKEFYRQMTSDPFLKDVAEFCSTEGIAWSFNPPSAPHHGGLWEAGVKSAKHHMRRIIGNHILTFEEMTTVLSQIEAVLNSRPLTPMSTDPNDLETLTPGHFLVGHALLAVPDPDVTHLKENRLSRWQLVQQVSQHFWKRWRNEYLAELQQRTRWTKEQENIAVGDLVLVKEDNLPPLNWARARVIELLPSKDGKSRIVNLKVATGRDFSTTELKRDIRKLCKLPLESV